MMRTNVDVSACDAIDGGGREILIVEDDPLVARMLARCLRGLRWRALIVEQPLLALALVAADPARFAVVITDRTLPDVDGVRLARLLRAASPGLPVILTTGGDLRLHGDEGSVTAVLPKPYSREMLAVTLLACVEPPAG